MRISKLKTHFLASLVGFCLITISENSYAVSKDSHNFSLNDNYGDPTSNHCPNDNHEKLLFHWLKVYQNFELEEFLGLYHENIQFKDPTAKLYLDGKEQLRKVFTPVMRGRYGNNFVFDIKLKAFSESQIAIGGNVSLTYNGIVTTFPFSTWLTIKNEKIISQLDMFDYSILRESLGDQLNSPPIEFKEQ